MEGSRVPVVKLKVSRSLSARLKSWTAETLCLSVAGLRDTQNVSCDERRVDLAMRQNCLDVIEAFVRVFDPNKRKHLIKVIRPAGKYDYL